MSEERYCGELVERALCDSGELEINSALNRYANEAFEVEAQNELGPQTGGQFWRVSSGYAEVYCRRSWAHQKKQNWLSQDEN